MNQNLLDWACEPICRHTWLVSSDNLHGEQNVRAFINGTGDAKDVGTRTTTVTQFFASVSLANVLQA